MALSPVPIISIAGTDFSRYVVKSSIKIDEQDGQAFTAEFIMVNTDGALTPPPNGIWTRIIIGLGDTSHRRFAGHILSVILQQWHKNQRKPHYLVKCIDYNWLFDAKTVSYQSSGVDLTTALKAVATAFCPDFDQTKIAAGLPTIDILSEVEERPSSFFNRQMKAVSGRAYLDYDLGIHAFVGVESGVTPPDDLDSSNANFWNFNVTYDGTQVRTRVRFRGNKSATVGASVAGDITLPVADCTPFLDITAGFPGYALVNGQLLSYTDKTAAEGPGELTGIPASSTGSITSDLVAGLDVQVLAIAEDAVAAATLASLMGHGDGFIEFSDEDMTMTATAAQVAAQANLDARKEIDTRITYECRDWQTRPGKIVTVDLTNSRTGEVVSGDFTIQNVQVNEFGKAATKYPRHVVEAGNDTQTLIGLLGGSPASGAVGVGSASAGSASVDAPATLYLGGNGIEDVSNTDGTTYKVIGGGLRVKIDGAEYASLTRTVIANVKSFNNGITMTLVLRDVTNNVDVGTSGAIVGTGIWQSTAVSVTLNAAEAEYELWLRVHTANESAFARGYMK